jgi:hypothetical protein
MIPHFKDTLEIKLLEDGTLAGSDKSKEGRTYYYRAHWLLEPIETLSGNMIDVYFTMFMMAMKNKSQIMWNVHTQSLWSENNEGYIYCVIGEGVEDDGEVLSNQEEAIRQEEEDEKNFNNGPFGVGA